MIHPLDVANKVAWYRYGKGITSAGGFASQWDDAFGLGHHLLQAIATNQPSLEADGSILCDGVDNYLKASAFTFDQPCTIYLLFKQITWTAGEYIFDGNTVAALAMAQKATGASPELVLYAGVELGLISLTLDTYGVVAAVFNGASSVLQLNNETPVEGNAGTQNAAGFTLGARGDITDFGHAQFKEVLLYSGAHDAETRTGLFEYLRTVGVFKAGRVPVYVAPDPTVAGVVPVQFVAAAPGVTRVHTVPAALRVAGCVPIREATGVGVVPVVDEP